MKKLLTLALVSMLLFSCKCNSVEDARKVKIGMTGNEIKYIMGEPWCVNVEPGEETWYFEYYSEGYTQRMHVTMSADKVTDFYSY